MPTICEDMLGADGMEVSCNGGPVKARAVLHSLRGGRCSFSYDQEKRDSRWNGAGIEWEVVMILIDFAQYRYYNYNNIIMSII